MRGLYTEEIEKKALQFFEKFDIVALHLLPYLDFCLKNEVGISHERVNKEENAFYRRWVEQGFIIEDENLFHVTRAFYDVMQDLLWEGYVSYEKENIA